MSKKFLLILLSLLLAGFASAQRKSITNADLEKYRQERLKAEAEYRAKYKELGQPSPEELEKREQEKQKELADFAQKAREEKRAIENSILSRANGLKIDISALDAEINYLRNRIGGLPARQAIATTIYQQPYYYGYAGGYRQPYQTNYNPGNYITINRMDHQYSAASVIRQYSQPPVNRNHRPRYRPGHIQLNGSICIGSLCGRNYPPYGYPGYAVSYPVEIQSYGREELISRLRHLEQQRAGLIARFDAIAEEARRAGIRVN